MSLKSYISCSEPLPYEDLLMAMKMLSSDPSKNECEFNCPHCDSVNKAIAKNLTYYFIKKDGSEQQIGNQQN